MIVYDCEIIKAIPPKQYSDRIDGIEYCDGWRDFENMGISVIGAYDYLQNRYRVFCQDTFDQFQELVDESETIVGFNSLQFDNHLVAANGLSVPESKTYDLLVEIWRAAGLGPKYEHETHTGFSLDAMALMNLGEGKTGNGALAPVLWQQGKIGQVIDYCLQDVRLTKLLLDRVIKTGFLISPKDSSVALHLIRP